MASISAVVTLATVVLVVSTVLLVVLAPEVIDLYSIGWSPTSNVGSRCGNATAPTSPSQVYHYLHVTVSDSGEGVPEDLREAIFQDGVSTRTGTGRPRGLGLALARNAARARGGDVTLADPGTDENGAVFVARLPEVLH